jgi:hypothetical protein
VAAQGRAGEGGNLEINGSQQPKPRSGDPVNRSTFKRTTYAPARTVHKPIAPEQRSNASMVALNGAFCAPIEKEGAIQHAGYMRLVRALPCAHCGIAGPSQFCHSDEGKGMGIKSDCRYGWPGCAVCHDLVGTQRIYAKENRRRIEADMAAKTRAQITALGQWPANLPQRGETN